MDHDEEREFRSFVGARSSALLRTAYLLVGDRGLAEDLLQVALVKTYLNWARIRDLGALEGYVRRVMATTAISWWRGRRFRERSVPQPPDRYEADPATAQIERDVMWSHLGSLPTRQRAVLVLRYYEGLSEAEIADTLGLNRGTVKSYAARGLATLRRRLSDDETGVGVSA